MVNNPRTARRLSFLAGVGAAADVALVIALWWIGPKPGWATNVLYADTAILIGAAAILAAYAVALRRRRKDFGRELAEIQARAAQLLAEIAQQIPQPRPAGDPDAPDGER
jgi:peptidoglycan/LPS O-acetylase OafA/YrhL